MRAIRSVLPPGENGTISVMFFDGYTDCAKAGPAAAAAAKQASSHADMRYLIISPPCKRKEISKLDAGQTGHHARRQPIHSRAALIVTVSAHVKRACGNPSLHCTIRDQQ